MCTQFLSGDEVAWLLRTQRGQRLTERTAPGSFAFRFLAGVADFLIIRRLLNRLGEYAFVVKPIEA